MSTARAEVQAGRRFAFGRNWQRFLTVVDEATVEKSVLALRSLLNVERLDGMHFLDIGSGSGLSSLAARRLGATVHSFDFDPDSVAATMALKERWAPGDGTWTIAQGSVLEREFVAGLQSADVVYSWGVLHHTGAMWQAMENATLPLKPGGMLAVALYNDQGLKSRVWRRIKRVYCSGAPGRAMVCAALIPAFVAAGLVNDLARGRDPIRRYRERGHRGMSVFYDWFDWFGGLPFEVASRDEVIRFYERRGFQLHNLISVGGRLGCNEFVFRGVRS